MAAVQITSANSNGLGLERTVVRTSAGVLYAVLLDINEGGIEVWKSTDGTSWAEQDASNNPANSAYKYPSCAIDSTGLIHIDYVSQVSMSQGIRYVTFNTSTDTFAGDVQITALTSVVITNCCIAVDSGDKPHVVFTDIISNMGSSFYTLYYTNKVSGSWSAKLEIEGSTASKSCRFADLTISDENIPEIAYLNDTDADVTAAQGNQNSATSFTLFDVENNTVVTFGPSIAIDSTGATIVAFVESPTNDCFIRMCPDGANWTTGWNARVALDATLTVRDARLACDGTNTHVFTADVTDNDIYYYKNTDARVKVDTTTQSAGNLSVKWAQFNNNQGATQIDYLFGDGTNVFWNKLTLAAFMPASQKPIRQAVNRAATY